MREPPGNKYNPRLDAIRGICALAVILFHWSLLKFGWIGVQVFFVLSGFLITESLLRTKRGNPTLRTYLIYFFEKRVLRLCPLYYGFLILLGISFLLFDWPATFGVDAPYLFTYTLNLIRMVPGHSPPTPYAHLWSLGVEWQFYLIWPFFVWKLSEKSLIYFSIALVMFAPLLREFTLIGASMVQTVPAAIGHICYMATWSHFDALAMGALLVRPEFWAWLMQIRVWATTVIMGLLGGAIVIRMGPHVHTETLGYPIFLPFLYQSVWGYSLISLLAACFIAQTSGRSWLTNVTDLNWLQYLGKISYGIYIYHFPLVVLGMTCLGQANRLSIEGIAILIAIILLDIGVAHLSYRYYESWFLRKKATLSLASIG